MAKEKPARKMKSFETAIMLIGIIMLLESCAGLYVLYSLQTMQSPIAILYVLIKLFVGLFVTVVSYHKAK